MSQFMLIVSQQFLCVYTRVKVPSYLTLTVDNIELGIIADLSVII